MRALRLAAACAGLTAMFAVGLARAAEPSAPEPAVRDERPAPAASSIPRPGTYSHWFATSAVGRGLRFNNPFRLETELGDGADSLSLTATYVDFGLGAVFGNPDGFRHGAVAHLSVAVEGVAQEVGSLSYILLRPFGRDVLGFARAGFPVVLEPDVSSGLELGVGGAWLLTGGIGVAAELVSSLFFGAATWEHDPTLVPLVSLQIGAWAQYEVLP